MPDQKPFAGVSQDETLETVLLSLREILNRMPLPDPTNETMRVSGTVALSAGAANIGAVGLQAGQTLAALTGLGNIVAIGSLNANTTVFDLMNASANSLYDQLIVS
jgi:hypothetical protein